MNANISSTILVAREPSSPHGLPHRGKKLSAWVCCSVGLRISYTISLVGNPTRPEEKQPLLNAI